MAGLRVSVTIGFMGGPSVCVVSYAGDASAQFGAS
jgi:hypothetical protein